MTAADIRPEINIQQLQAELEAAGLPQVISLIGNTPYRVAGDGSLQPLSRQAMDVVAAHRPLWPTVLSRDERIISAADVRKERIAAKKAAILASGLPTATKTAMADLLDGMADIVDGLVEAIQGGKP